MFIFADYISPAKITLTLFEVGYIKYSILCKREKMSEV